MKPLRVSGAMKVAVGADHRSTKSSRWRRWPDGRYFAFFCLGSTPLSRSPSRAIACRCVSDIVGNDFLSFMSVFSNAMNACRLLRRQLAVDGQAEPLADLPALAVADEAGEQQDERAAPRRRTRSVPSKVPRASSHACINPLLRSKPHVICLQQPGGVELSTSAVC